MKINEDFTRRSKVRDIGRWHINQFVSAAAASLPDNALLLDAGAGECAYRRFFPHCQYRSLDLAVGDSQWNYEHLDYISPIDAMPIENDLFDAILCTEVLEHLEKPYESVQEMYRVLKPGGKLFLTVPMSHAEHQTPYDFFRYTSFGLEKICQKAGFSSIKITPFGGMFTRWAYELPDAKSVFPHHKNSDGKYQLSGILALPAKIVVHIATRILQHLLLAIDPWDKKRDFPFGWGVICEK